MEVITPGKKCNGLTGPCPIWINSQYSLIQFRYHGKVPSDISILIQQGKNDSHTPIEQAFLLQQKLTELRHPDHYVDYLSEPGSSVLSFISMDYCSWTNGSKGSRRPL